MSVPDSPSLVPVSVARVAVYATDAHDLNLMGPMLGLSIISCTPFGTVKPPKKRVLYRLIDALVGQEPKTNTTPGGQNRKSGLAYDTRMRLMNPREDSKIASAGIIIVFLQKWDQAEAQFLKNISDYNSDCPILAIAKFDLKDHLEFPVKMRCLGISWLHISMLSKERIYAGLRRSWQGEARITSERRKFQQEVLQRMTECPTKGRQLEPARSTGFTGVVHAKSTRRLTNLHEFPAPKERTWADRLSEMNPMVQRMLRPLLTRFNAE